MDLVDSVIRHYHEGRPKHVRLVGESFFTSMDENTFSEMSPTRVQVLLQKNVIVVYNTSLPRLTFSRHGIRQLNSLNTDVRIQGMSNISYCYLSDLF